MPNVSLLPEVPPSCLDVDFGVSRSGLPIDSITERWLRRAARASEPQTESAGETGLATASIRLPEVDRAVGAGNGDSSLAVLTVFDG